MTALINHRVAVLPGDGIGKEVVPPALRVLERAGELGGFGFEWFELPWGCEFYLETGQMMPDGGLESLREHEAIFLGAVGAPTVPDHISLWELLIPIRREYRQFINLRPIRLLDGVPSPLRQTAGDIDFVVVRENNEGEYSEIGGRIYRGTEEELAVQESVFTRRGSERVLRYAFDLAASRDGRLVAATKSNGIVHTMPFWDEVCHDVAKDYPSVEVSLVHVDALAARFVLDPAGFDVVVASNLFGDILTDLGAAVVGSIGIAPSANLNPGREFPSMFEPLHGSAPDIAGQGIANPIGQIWSGAMMLDHLGHTKAAEAVVSAVQACLANGGARPRDLGGDAGTEEAAAAIADKLEHEEVA